MLLRVRCVDDGRELLIEGRRLEWRVQVATIKRLVLAQRRQQLGGHAASSSLIREDGKDEGDDDEALGESFLLFQGRILADSDMVNLFSLTPADFFVFVHEGDSGDARTEEQVSNQSSQVRKQLLSMGFTRAQVDKALRRGHTELEQLVELIMSDDGGEETPALPPMQRPQEKALDPGLLELQEKALADPFAAVMLMKEQFSTSELEALIENPASTVETLRRASMRSVTRPSAVDRDEVPQSAPKAAAREVEEETKDNDGASGDDSDPIERVCTLLIISVVHVVGTDACARDERIAYRHGLRAGSGSGHVRVLRFRRAVGRERAAADAGDVSRAWRSPPSVTGVHPSCCPSIYHWGMLRVFSSSHSPDGGKDGSWRSSSPSEDPVCYFHPQRHARAAPSLWFPTLPKPSLVLALDTSLTAAMKPFAALVGASALLLSQPQTEAMDTESACRPHLRRVEEAILPYPLQTSAMNASDQVKTPQHYAQKFLRGSSVEGIDEAEPDGEPEPESEPEPEGEDEGGDGECSMEDFDERNASEVATDTPASIESSVVDEGDSETDVFDGQDATPSVDADIGSGDLEIDSLATSWDLAVHYAAHLEDNAMHGAGGRRQPAREAWHLGGYRSAPSRAVYHEQYLMDPYSIGGDFVRDQEELGFMGRRGRGSPPWADARRW